MVIGDRAVGSAQGWLPFLLGTALSERQFVAGRGIIELLASQGYARGAVRVGLSRLSADGTLERVRDGRTTRYRMGSQSMESVTALAHRVERFGREVVWNGTWTLVLASIPDDLRPTRRRLAGNLAFLGFGRLRDAAWIAARECEAEVRSLIENLAIEDVVDVFVGHPPGFTDTDQLLRRCWDINALTSRYTDFQARFEPLRDAAFRAGLTDTETVTWWMQLAYDYRDLVRLDPELPPEFLPEPARAQRAEAVETYAQVQAGLDPRALAEIRRYLVAPGPGVHSGQTSTSRGPGDDQDTENDE